MIKPQGRGGGGGGRVFSGSLPNSQLGCVIMRSISCWGGGTKWFRNFGSVGPIWKERFGAGWADRCCLQPSRVVHEEALKRWPGLFPPPAQDTQKHHPVERRSLRHVQNRRRVPCERARLLWKEHRGELERRAMWQRGPIWFLLSREERLSRYPTH